MEIAETQKVAHIFPIRTVLISHIITMCYRIQLIPLPSFESSDPEVAASLLSLKQHLSTCVGALQPLRVWGPILKRRGIIDTSLHSPQYLVDLLNDIAYGHPLGELFEDTKNRSQIWSDRSLAAEIMSLLVHVPRTSYPPVDKTSDELTLLRQFSWDHLPEEWKPWRDAIRVLDSEAKMKLFIDKYEKALKPSPYKKEPFTDAGVKFVERDEHFWWAGRSDDEDEDNKPASPLNDDETVVEVDVTRKYETETVKVGTVAVKKVEPVVIPQYGRERAESVRGELWEWTPGGDCPA